MSFQSVHDMLVPPGIVRKTKFWDFFDGDSLRSWWTRIDHSGTGTDGMVDGVDEGAFVKADTASSGNMSALGFDSPQHYSDSGSVFISVVRAVNTDGIVNVGLRGNIQTQYSRNSIQYDNRDGETFKRLVTGDNSTTTLTDSTVAVDQAWTKTKGEARTSSALLFIDDVLEVATTSTLPTTKMEPIISDFNISGGPAETRVRYYEAYNT